jgi:glycogen operon protein
MLSHGDELGRSQLGNNNAYCHDSPLSWVDWEPDAAGRELLDFARRVFALRREHPVLRSMGFFTGKPVAEGRAKDLSWLRPEGGEFGAADWHDPERRQLGMLISGDAHDALEAPARGAHDDLEAPARGAHSRADASDSLLLLLNGAPADCYFRLPPMPEPGRFENLIATAAAELRRDGSVFLPARSLALLAFRGGDRAL